MPLGVELAERMIDEGATNPVLNYLLGLALQETQERKAEAIAHFNRALAAGFDPAWPRFHRGRLRVELGDSDGVEDLLQAQSAGGSVAAEATAYLARHAKRIAEGRYSVSSAPAEDRRP